MGRQRILIVDAGPVPDLPGYDVRAAGSVDEALRAVEFFRPALILADVHLPGIGRLRSGVPLVALTERGVRTDEEKARIAGCDGYISRPADALAIRAFLDDSDLADLKTELREKLLAEGLEETRRMRNAPAEGFDVPRARRVLHRWAGVAGTIGLMKITERARELEHLLEQQWPEVRSSFHAGLDQLAQLFVGAAGGG